MLRRKTKSGTLAEKTRHRVIKYEEKVEETQQISKEMHNVLCNYIMNLKEKKD